MIDFVAEYEAGSCRTSTESLEVEWLSRDEILEKVQTSAYPYRLQKMLNFQGKISHTSYRTHPDFQLIHEYYI